MKLTGKAKEDFKEYAKQKGLSLSLQEIFINALIIEWFDSVGIEIFLNLGFIIGTKKTDGIDYDIFYENKKYSGCALTRQEATEKAIIKANEIYNERFN